MNEKNARSALLSSLVLLGVIAQGCGPGSASESEAPDPESDAQSLSALERGFSQGITVLEANPGLGAKVAYRASNRVVYVETRRESTPTPPELLAADTTLQPYSTDLKVTDRDGSLIYARITGDGADWIADAREQPRSLAGRALDLALARQALAALESPSIAGLPAGFNEEQGAVRDALAAFDAQSRAQPSTAANSLETSELAGAQGVSAAATYKHRVELWSMACCVPGGRHSATRTSNWNGKAWVSTVDFCNHGTCPNKGGMTEDCSYTSGLRSGVARARMCTTAYNVTSFLWGHNCNDDSHLEVIDVRHNTLHATNKGSCSDVGANPTPDGCDPGVW